MTLDAVSLLPVLAYLDDHDLARITTALLDLDDDANAVHVADYDATTAGASIPLSAALMTHAAWTLPPYASQLAACHPRSCRLFCSSGSMCTISANQKRFSPPMLLTAEPPGRASEKNGVDQRGEVHSISCIDVRGEMSSRQIVPQADTQAALATASKGSAAAMTAPRSERSLAMLFQRLALARRRRAQQQEHQQRASWPLVRTDKREGFARRAQQSLLNAWATLHRESSARRSGESLFSAPHFLLRTQRRISQRFNLKIVQAVGKDVRRSESQRRSSLTMLEAPGSNSSLASGSSESGDDGDNHEFPLRMSERLSLSLGRRISRDFAPMLTEGTALECRVREMVYGLLRDPATLEGHVCASFFAKQESFTSTLPAACRYYLTRVRDTISDLVQFVVEYRLRNLDDDFLPVDLTNNQEYDSDAIALELETAVRRAVEEYFCFSLRYEIRHWCAAAADVEHRSRFRKTLAKWSALPPTSREFGLKTKDMNLASQPQVALAIEKLQDLETTATPSRKMDSLLAACHALSEFIAQGRSEPKSYDNNASGSIKAGPAPPLLSPTSRVCLGDADSFLPLLIFAVTRSKLRDPFAQCAWLLGMYPFASQHGERMYYLTMLEASLQFLRTHS